MQLDSYRTETRYVEGDEDDTGSRRTGLIVGLVLVVLAAVAIWLILRAARPPFIPAPTAFTTYTATDNSFTIDQPVGWSSSGSGAGAVTSGVVFKAGRAKIDVTSDLAGSLMGDMAQAQNNQYESIREQSGANLPPPTPVIEKIHNMGLQAAENRFDKYQEQPMFKVQCKAGEGRVSEFTADGGAFTGKLHGYRATVLSQERRLTIITVCTESNWSTLQPAFARVIQSIGRGTG